MLVARSSSSSRRFVQSNAESYESFSLVDAIDRLDSSASWNICTWVLRQCTAELAVDHGRRAHARIAELGRDTDTHLGNLLVHMYGACGSMPEALDAFQRIRAPNLYSWNILVAQLVRNGHLHRAVETLHRAPQWSVLTVNLLLAAYTRQGFLHDARVVFDAMANDRDSSSWNTMIQAYAASGDFDEVMDLFDQMTNRDVISWSTVLSFLRNDGRMSDALQVFEMMPQRNVVSWNTLLAAFAETGDVDGCIALFMAMAQRSIVSWNSVMHACAVDGNLGLAIELHRRAPKLDIFSWNAVITAYTRSGHLQEALDMVETLPCERSVGYNVVMNAYAQAGDFDKARHLFDMIPYKNVVAWNVMIQAYAQSGHIDEAKALFDRATERNVLTWMFLVGFSNQVHVYAWPMFEKMPCHDTFAWNMMLQAHPDCAATKQLFDRMPSRDIVSWTALVTAYGLNQQVSNAELTLSKMPQLSEISWNALLSAYSSSSASSSSTDDKYLRQAWDVFKNRMEKRDDLSWTVMLSTFADSSRPEMSSTVFDKMPQWSLLSWNALLRSHVQEGRLSHALRLFSSGMPQRNSFSWNILLTGLSQNERVDEVKQLFAAMPARSTVSWNSMIQALALNNDPRAAISLYCSMDLEGIPPNDSTFANVLEACSISSALDQGMEIHRDIVSTRTSMSSSLAGVLVNFYGQCGIPDEAIKIFSSSSSPPAAVAGWNAMIAALARHGHGKQAAEFFVRMLLEGLEMDTVAFAGILTACGYAGMVNEAREFLMVMLEHGVAAGMEHYHCMIEVLCRVGEIRQGQELVTAMPFHPGVVPWNMLLSNVHADGKVGARVGEEIMSLQPVESAPYVMLSNTMMNQSSSLW